jgi:hypothetical protein
MAIRVSNNNNYNPVRVLLADNSAERKTRIRLDEKANEESKAYWNAKQLQTYPNLTQITQNSPSMANIITKEVQAKADDDQVQYGLAIENLKSVADLAHAEYIIDRLSTQEIFYLNTYFTGIVLNMRKKSKQMSKDVFVNFVKASMASDPTFSPVPSALSVEAQRRLAARQAAIRENNERDQMGDQDPRNLRDNFERGQRGREQGQMGQEDQPAPPSRRDREREQMGREDRRIPEDRRNPRDHEEILPPQEEDVVPPANEEVDELIKNNKVADLEEIARLLKYRASTIDKASKHKFAIIGHWEQMAVYPNLRRK